MTTKVTDDRQGPYRVGFLLVENFTLISLSSARSRCALPIFSRGASYTAGA